MAFQSKQENYFYVSFTFCLVDKTGRRSPQQLQLVSPSGGRRSPVFLMYDGNRTPLDLLESRRSPTTIFPDRSKSPTGLYSF